jgi:hypothetical protein
MSPLEIVITSIGGSAVLFTVVGFLARSLVLHLLSKDIAKFKVDLEKIAYGHQIRFSQLHDKRAQVIAELYGSIVALERKAEVFVRLLLASDKEKNNSRLIELWDAADKFQDVFQKNRIYFEERICKKIDSLNESLSDPISKLVMHNEMSVQSNNYKDLFQSWDAATKQINEIIPGVKSDIEFEFRNILGVLDANKNNT